MQQQTCPRLRYWCPALGPATVSRADSLHWQHQADDSAKHAASPAYLMGFLEADAAACEDELLRLVEAHQPGKPLGATSPAHTDEHTQLHVTAASLKYAVRCKHMPAVRCFGQSHFTCCAATSTAARHLDFCTLPETSSAPLLQGAVQGRLPEIADLNMVLMRDLIYSPAHNMDTEAVVITFPHAACSLQASTVLLEPSLANISPCTTHSTGHMAV